MFYIITKEGDIGTDHIRSIDPASPGAHCLAGEQAPGRGRGEPAGGRGGGGERLRHIDEGYNKLEGYYIKGKPEDNSNQLIQENQEEVKKAKEEKDEIIQDLFQRANLEATQKKEVLTKLKKNDEELERTRLELIRLQNLNKSDFLISEEKERRRDLVIHHFHNFVVPENNFLKSPSSTKEFIKNFNKIAEDQNLNWLHDLSILGWYDSVNGLNRVGALNLMRNLRN